MKVFFAYEPNKLLYMFAAETSGVVERERMGTAFPHKKLSGNGVPTSDLIFFSTISIKFVLQLQEKGKYFILSTFKLHVTSLSVLHFILLHKVKSN